MDLSIVIPVYKSGTILPALLKEIKQEITFVKKFELILVNDNSPDNSWQVISSLKKRYKFIKGINLMQNFSQHNAIMAGLNEATGKIIIMMDDDLQHSPADVRKIYNMIITEKCDVCYTRFRKKKHSMFKNAGSMFNDIIAKILLKKPKSLYLSPFKGITDQVKNLVIKYDGPYPYVDGLILSITKNIKTIEIDHHDRFEGKGNYTITKLISLWTMMATGFSVLPLRVAAYAGVIISVFAFILLIFYIILRFMDNALPTGITTIIVLILFFGGIQLLSLGVIGEYLGRLYLNSNKKQQYSIRERV